MALNLKGSKKQQPSTNQQVQQPAMDTNAMQQTTPSPSVQQQQYQQQFVSQTGGQQPQAPQFTQKMYNQMQQLLQMEQQGNIQPQQVQYLAQLKQRYMEFQAYNNSRNGAGVPIGNQDMLNNNGANNVPPTDPNNMMNGQNTPNGKKKKPIIPIVLGVAAVLILGLVAKSKLGGGAKTDSLPYEQTGRYIIDNTVAALNNFDAEQLDTLIGTEDGDSYLAQEMAYVNNVPLRVQFLQKVASVVSVQYPTTEITNRKGKVISSYESDMLNGETCMVTVPDYAALCDVMEQDKDTIKKLYKSAKISPETTYTYQDDWFNLFCQYYIDYVEEVPTTQKEVKFNIGLSVNNEYYLKDDIDIDQVLFSSDELHSALDKFSQICTDYTGTIEETYTEQELVHNDEYDRWLELFLQYFTEDGGVYDQDTNTFSNVEKAFHKGVSKWEPWYVRDEDNVIQKNEDGTYKVNYFSVKDENGNDWIQPAEEEWQEVEKTREVADPWEDERGIWYNNTGTYYIQNLYNGKGLTIFRVGDGSIDNPAGVGTPIITKVMDTNGVYHDVEVTLLAYWNGQDAIDYVQKFDTRNRGFNVSSVVQLIAYEIQVRNLDGETYTFNSEMSLCDRNSNTASRTGTMYSFSKDIELAAGETVIINDWANSTELEQKYVVWGKSFSRNYPYVYFRILAGEGNVPAYSAYDYFVTTQAHVSNDEVEYTQDSITN